MTSRATNANLMKVKNRKLILNLIRQQGMSRAQISKITGLTKASISNTVEFLLSKKIITETPSDLGKVGRNPLILALAENAFFIPCVNITRKFVDVGILNWCGTEVSSKRLVVGTPQQTISTIAKELKKQIKASKIDNSKFFDVGLTTPGPVDTGSGKILNATNFDAWKNINIVAELSKRLQRNVILDNVSNGCALGEFYFGTAKNVSNFLSIIVDEGIGAGAVVDGKLFRKMNEWGHTTIKFDGKKCPCGNTGCLEIYASTSSILKGSKYTSWKDVVDANAKSIIKKEAEYLSAGITSALNIFDFDLILLSSEISYKPDYILELIRSNIKNTLSRKIVDVDVASAKTPLCYPAALSLHKFFVYEM